MPSITKAGNNCDD